MVYKVSWTARALETYLNNIEYLETKWTAREIKRFTAATEKKIKTLRNNPALVLPEAVNTGISGILYSIKEFYLSTGLSQLKRKLNYCISGIPGRIPKN